MTSEDQNNDTRVFNKGELKPKKAETTNLPTKRRQAKRQKQKERRKKREGKLGRIRGRIRYIPVWLRVILIILICMAAFFGGLSFGYAGIGEGEDPNTVLDLDFWQGMLEYMRGK
ncbi:DNA-directed RNA polymerase subunit beta [Tenuibacillus multivorans]|uniref:DNA-directed RNA polymerase subunit beta n=1 Tax=Tenuibacillus multivorans TaxID=237069 RepID=A0A1G9X4H4_9BACI|nr:DNA-directed RNA polymerase subunit beta [Tenuibacillus multivorans]GEL77229.1 hypothetical protein TMU01_14640 [Tenuibacillus multivorans]SDM91660.1 DNA-directed RNA polymerase subunit beta [Tenuibacillus multivorans]